MKPILVGQTVSHYRIVDDLGGGGMARVYRAVDLRLEREVVLKFLPARQSQHPESRERLVREAKAASSLDHPNICTIHEIDQTEDGRLFIAMTFYRGQTVEDRLAEAPLPVAEAVRVTAEVLAGLAAAHGRGIVHRDIKPANLMLTQEGRVKILDFGIAKLKNQSGITETGATVGTVAYISPEQLEGEAVDARSDVWSVGVVLYEMLTGRHPFDADTAGGVMNAILHRTPQPPSTLRPDLPEGFDLLVGRALAKRPEQRFASAEEFRRALPLAEMETDVTLATLPTGSRAARRAPRRRRWLVAAAAAAVVAALAAVQLARRPAVSAQGPYTIAVLPFANLTGDDDKDYLARGISASLITQLSELVGLRVLSRAEAWSRAGDDAGALALASQLGVDSLLEGEVQQEAERLRTTVSITDGDTGAVIWSGTFASSADEIFSLQTEIARRVTQALEIQLSPRERQRLDRDPTRSAQAYEYYLRGRETLDGPEAADTLPTAAAMFRQAIRFDDRFALAHAGLSEALWRAYHRDLDADALAGAEAAADRALDLDPQLPAAIVARARVLRSTGRQTSSIEELERVLERHPKPATAYREIAASLEEVGNLEEAERALRLAIALDEEDWNAWSALGNLLARRGQAEAARAALERAAEQAPTDVLLPRVELGTFELNLGRFDDAIARFEALPRPIRDARAASNLGTAYYFSGHPDRLERAADAYRLAVELAPTEAALRRNLADVYLELGREREARLEYQRAFELVGEELSANSMNVELQLQATEYAAKADQCDVALARARPLYAGAPPTSDGLHRLAVAFALCGDAERAIAAIGDAVRLGFAPDIIRAESEFAALRDLPAFAEALAAAATDEPR